jgi:hypothetical protein
MTLPFLPLAKWSTKAKLPCTEPQARNPLLARQLYQVEILTISAHPVLEKSINPSKRSRRHKWYAAMVVLDSVHKLTSLEPSTADDQNTATTAPATSSSKWAGARNSSRHRRYTDFRALNVFHQPAQSSLVDIDSTFTLCCTSSSKLV